MLEDLALSVRLSRHEAVIIGAWVNHHAAVMLAAALVAGAAKAPVFVALAGAVSFAILWHQDRANLTKLRPYGGYANCLTAVRLVLILSAAALMYQLSELQLLVLFAANVGMDIGDGFLARRNGQVTRFGTAFDREVDAVFVMVAYMYFFLVEDVAAWILLPALLPYIYRLVVCSIRDASADQEKRSFAALLAGVNFILLPAAAVAPLQIQMPMLFVSTGIVALSFAVSFWNLYRDEHPIP